jgi:hypothetical protein
MVSDSEVLVVWARRLLGQRQHLRTGQAGLSRRLLWPELV